MTQDLERILDGGVRQVLTDAVANRPYSHCQFVSQAVAAVVVAVVVGASWLMASTRCPVSTVAPACCSQLCAGSGKICPMGVRAMSASAWLGCSSSASRSTRKNTAALVCAGLLLKAAIHSGSIRLVCTRGLMWRKLDENERAEMDEAKALALMERYPVLIKRPVIDTGDALLVGFDAERYARELKR